VKKLESFGSEVPVQEGNTSQVTARSTQAPYESKLHGIAANFEHNRYGRGRGLGGKRAGGRDGDQYGSLESNKVSSQCWQAIVVTLGPTIFEGDVMSLGIPLLTEPIAESLDSNDICFSSRRPSQEARADQRHLVRLFAAFGELRRPVLCSNGLGQRRYYLSGHLWQPQGLALLSAGLFI
jgi:hypothetical protein